MGNAIILAQPRDKWWERLAHIRNGKIGDGVHVAYEWTKGVLIRAYIGHEAIGPCLQYDVSGEAYSGNLRVDMRGHWYNIYSRGNYGCKYACGGNWSSQHKSLHARLARYTRTIPEVSIEVAAGGHLVTREEMDGSPYWAIAHKSAAVSFADRLTAQEIEESSLPISTKQHLASKQTDEVMGCIRDIIEAYSL
jgi:hypothetical protein